MTNSFFTSVFGIDCNIIGFFCVCVLFLAFDVYKTVCFVVFWRSTYIRKYNSKGYHIYGQLQHFNRKLKYLSYVFIFLLACSVHRVILSKPINVALPTLCFFRNSTHVWAVSIESTTMLSKAPHAVEIATSNLSSIAPRSPCKTQWTKN